jgi:hypothetical protein
MAVQGSPIVRLVATPRKLTDGTTITLRMAGGGDRVPYNFGGVAYRSGIVDLPRFSIQFGWDENGWTGGARPQVANVTWSPSLPADVANYASLYMWKNAAITAEIGYESNRVVGGVPVWGGAEPGSWTSVLTGFVQGMTAQDGTLVFTVADGAAKMDLPLLVGHFAGTGNIEGPAEAEGREKRRSYGYVFNVEGRILDKANSIYEFGDPAFPFQSFVDVKDMGRSASPAFTTVPWQGTIAATLTALQLAGAAPGSCVVAPSICCVKWWTQPQGPITADIIGSGDYGNTAIALAKHIATEQGLTLSTLPSTVTSLMANTANAGLHVGNDSMTAAQALDRLLLGAGVFWRFAPAGTLDILPIGIVNSVGALTAQRIARQKIYPQHKTRRLGYKRNERLHSDGEISAALLTQNPAVLSIDMKKGWLAGQVADLEGRYTLLRARAVALGISVANVDGQRANLLGLLAGYSPAWNDLEQETPVLFSAWPDRNFPTSWQLNSGATQAPNGVFTTISDPSTTLFGELTKTGVPAVPGQQWSVGVEIKKDSVSTRRPSLRVIFEPPGKYFGVLLNTVDGSFTTETNMTGDGWTVYDTGQGTWLIVLAATAPALTTSVRAALYPALAGGGVGAIAATVTGSVDIKDQPELALGYVGKLGLPVLLGHLNALSAALTDLQKSISEIDATLAVWTTVTGTGKPDNYATNGAYGDVNRVRFAQFERGLVGWARLYNPDSNVTVSVGTISSTYQALAVQGSFTAGGGAASGTERVGSGGSDGIANPSVRIPVTAGERIFAGARFATSTGSGTHSWQLVIQYQDINGNPIGSSQIIATSPAGFGVSGNPRYGVFLIVPAGAVSAWLELYIHSNGAAGTSIIYLIEPMVCSAAPNQTAWPPFTPGPNNMQLDASTSVVIEPFSDIIIRATNAGVVKSGELPRNYGFTASVGNQNVTGLGAWSITAQTGMTATIGSATGTLNITALSVSEIYLPVQFVYGGVTRNAKAHIVRQDDPPTAPGGGGGGGGGTGTSVSTTTLGDTINTSYNLSTDKSATLTCHTGSAGSVALEAPIAYTRIDGTHNGITGAAGKWQWLNGATWTDVAAEVLSSTSPNQHAQTQDLAAGEPGVPPDWYSSPGALTVNQTKSGLSANTDYQFRFVWRRIDVSGTACNVYYSGGTMKATGS